MRSRSAQETARSRANSLGTGGQTGTREPSDAGRNSGDDLAMSRFRDHSRLMSTHTVSSRYEQPRRLESLPNLADTEEVTGSIPVSPTSKTPGQIGRYRILVTTYCVVAPYDGSKMGAQDH